MKKWLLLLSVITFSGKLLAENMPADRVKMQQLIVERTKLFSQYSQAVNKKSGLFGNKTKKDLSQSQDLLKQIVETDNLIMDELNRSLNYRTFEKSTMTYDLSDYENRIYNLQRMSDTLSSRLQIAETERTLYKNELHRNRFYFSFLILMCVGLMAVAGYLFFRYRRSHLG